MTKDDLADIKRERLLAAAEVCSKACDTYFQEAESVLEVARLYHDKLGRYRPNLQNLDHAMRRTKRKKMALDETMTEEGYIKMQNLTTEINAELVRWTALKHCSSVVFFGQTFNGRTNEQRLMAAKTMVAKRDGVLLTALDDESQYSTTEGKRGPERQICRMNGEVCAKEVLSLARDLATQDSAQVDVVAGGKEWLDVRNLLEHRLLEHMAEAGWDWGQYELGDDVAKEDYEDIPLVRRYRWMCEAAKMNRVDYEVPTLRLCLPSIGREQEEIAILLDQIRRMDSAVKIIIEDKNSWIFHEKAPEDWKQRLIKPVEFDLTDSVVIEMTLINSLISEISHAHLEAEPWHCHQVRAQIAEEKRGLRAVETIYPLLRERRLLVTRSTAEKLRELLGHIGTARERERAHLLIPGLAENHGASEEGAVTRGALTREETRLAFAALSVHEVPADVNIPFGIIEDDEPPARQLPSAANQLMDLVESAHSDTLARALLAGWNRDFTVITGNAIMRKQVHRWIDELCSYAEKGPRIVVSKTCRIMLSAEVGPAKMFYKEDGTEDRQKLREWRMSRESKVVRGA